MATSSEIRDFLVTPRQKITPEQSGSPTAQSLALLASWASTPADKLQH